MSGLPNGWETCLVGDVTHIVAGGTPPSKEPSNFQEAGGIPWLTPADLSGYRGMYISRVARNLSETGCKASSAKTMPAGTVLFSNRAPIDYVAIPTNEISTNQGFKSFVLSDALESRFVNYQLRPIKPIAESIATGTTFKELSGAAAATLPISIAPLTEQKRIAYKVDTVLARVDACRERLDRVALVLKRFRQSVVSCATSGKLTEDWRTNRHLQKKETSSNFYDVTTAGTNNFLPSEWKIENLEKLVKLDLGYAFKSAEFKKTGTRLLRGDNIEPGKLRWREPAFYDSTLLDNFQHLFLNAGDIVLAMDRPIVSNGLKIARVNLSDTPCVLVQRVCRFVPCEHISAEYLYQTLSSNTFTNYLLGTQKGSQIPHISGKQILSFEISVPPIAEQHEIVRRVETLFAFADRLEARLATARTAANRLTPALLAKAFRGELVPQDPNDEPAAILLARLAEARDENVRRAKRSQKSATLPST